MARMMDHERWKRSAVSPLPAIDLYYRHDPPVSGSEVANVYGLVAHYTTKTGLIAMRAAQFIGAPRGCWLTPTCYAACLAPYDMGLASPRDMCLLIDVRDIDTLWGPGTSPPSNLYHDQWWGGAIEFYTPNPISFALVVKIYEIEPCGDLH